MAEIFLWQHDLRDIWEVLIIDTLEGNFQRWKIFEGKECVLRKKISTTVTDGDLKVNLQLRTLSEDFAPKEVNTLRQLREKHPTDPDHLLSHPEHPEEGSGTHELLTIKMWLQMQRLQMVSQVICRHSSSATLQESTWNY